MEEIRAKCPNWSLVIALPQKRAPLPHELSTSSSLALIPSQQSPLLTLSQTQLSPPTLAQAAVGTDSIFSSNCDTARAIFFMWILSPDFFPLNVASNTACQPLYPCTFNYPQLISSGPSCHSTCAYSPFTHFLWIWCVAPQISWISFLMPILTERFSSAYDSSYINAVLTCLAGWMAELVWF